MSTKPIWFLDIDGVINSYPKPPEESEWKFEFKRILGYPIWYAPELIEFINRVHASGKVEVRWLTTWEDRANEAFAPEVGIEHQFVVYSRHHEYGDHDWWKADHIRDFRKENPDTPLVWTDDDIRFYLIPSHVDGLVGDDALVISPRTRGGLTPEHIKLIEEFIE